MQLANLVQKKLQEISNSRLESGRTQQEMCTLSNHTKKRKKIWTRRQGKDMEVGVPQDFTAHQMLGAPQGINQHIKHNITSCSGVQSLVFSWELLYYVLLPQFKSQELETNAPQTGLAHRKSIRGGRDRVSIRIKFKNSTESSYIRYPRGDKHPVFLWKLAAIHTAVRDCL